MPRRIASQITLLVIGTVVIFHLTMTGMSLLTDRRGEGPMPPGPILHQFQAFAHVLDALPPSARAQASAAMASAYPDLQLVWWEPGDRVITGDVDVLSLQQPDPEHRFAVLAGSIRDAIGHRRDVAFRLGDGSVVKASLPAFPNPDRLAGAGARTIAAKETLQSDLPLGNYSPEPAPPGGPPPDMPRRGPPSVMRIILATFGFITLNLILLSIWASRGLTAPLSRFARAAEEFALDQDPTPLPETGPEEVRVASRALNRLQQRVKDLVRDRTRMLAAIGHDLRTPITRLQLRAEFIADAASRAQILEDLGQMSRMIHSVLSYFRYGQQLGNRTFVDLASLLQAVCDQFIDLGETARYEGPDHLLVMGYPDELHRAVTNLVENAIKFGETALIQLRATVSGTAEIEVADEGPGIPEAEREAMMEPFARGHDARGTNGPAGFGLGLAIARAAVDAHGGKLILRGRSPSGLVAHISLPLAVDRAAA